jgi:NADH-quinone oxidoreductase subunit D
VATDLLLGIGTAAFLPCDAPLALHPSHPAVNPGFQLQVHVDDAGIVTSADPRVGLMHRSAEKLFESRDWRQAMALADRHDWLSAFSSEVGVALAFEAALGITPPERATWIRTLLAEANRISASLAFITPVAGPLQAEVDALRERLTDVQEQVTGGRVHPGFARVGGVAGPISAAALASYADVLDDLDGLAPRLADAVRASTEPLAGIAVLTREDVVELGVTGVVGRASGLALDLRRDDPYLAYGELGDLVEVVTDTAGDVPARYRVLVDQLAVSGRLMAACADAVGRLGDGPVDVPLPKVVRIPEGMTYAWIDGPLGVSGCLLVGSGAKYPWRMKIRSASFATMQALPRTLPGTPFEQLAEAVMSFPMVMGDVDR